MATFWSTQGVYVQVQHTNGTFINIPGVESFDIQGGQADKVSFKPLESNSAYTFPGSPSDITVTLPLGWDPQDVAQQFMLSRLNNTTARAFKVFLPITGSNNVITFNGTVSQFTPTLQGNAVGKINCELLMSGSWSI